MITRFEELATIDRIAIDTHLSEVAYGLMKRGQLISVQNMVGQVQCLYQEEMVQAWLAWRDRQMNQGEFQEKLLSVLERIAKVLEER